MTICQKFGVAMTIEEKMLYLMTFISSNLLTPPNVLFHFLIVLLNYSFIRCSIVFTVCDLEVSTCLRIITLMIKK